MLTQFVRRNGNSLAVTIPREEAERLDLHEGDLVVLEVRKARITPELRADLAPIVDEIVDRYAVALNYLAER